MLLAKTISSLPTHTIHYGWIIDSNGAHIDQVLFLLMRAPNTFTGDDTVEITCHNNPFIIQNIIQAALHAAHALHKKVNFLAAQYQNNKIDIVQAEAINDLIHANTQLALKNHSHNLKAAFLTGLQASKSILLKRLALSEASFEFLDEENMEFRCSNYRNH